MFKKLVFPNICNPVLNQAEIEIDDYSVDVCLMATVLHDFEEMNKSGAVLKQVKTILKPGGHLAVIEFKKVDGPPGPPKNIRLSEEQTKAMVSEYGFRNIRGVDIGDFNYLIMFQEV